MAYRWVLRLVMTLLIAGMVGIAAAQSPATDSPRTDSSGTNSSSTNSSGTDNPGDGRLGTDSPGADTGSAGAPSDLNVEMPEIPNYWNPALPPQAPQQVIRQIRFVTADDFPPFNFLDAENNLIGFNVDLARAMCEVLNAQCTMAIRPFATLPDALRQRQADVAIAGVVPGENRDLIFSTTYLSFPGRFIARSDSEIEAYPEALEGVAVGVVDGSQHLVFLQDYFPRSEPEIYRTPGEMRAAVRAGDIPIAFDDAMTASYWLASDSASGCCAFRGGPYLNRDYFGDGLQLALVEGNEVMRDAVEHALYRVFATGRYAEIYLRYFPVTMF